MLNPMHAAETVATAKHLAPSAQGNCIELTDILSRLAGIDMREAAANAPFEFATFAELLRQTISAANSLEAVVSVGGGQ